MPTDISHLHVDADELSLRLRGDASYLLVGGLGGVGRSIASWLVRNGAKALIFLSRSGRSEHHDHFCKELETKGCGIQVLKGSVAIAEDVNKAVHTAAVPIRGVVNLSMALQDRAVGSMSYEDWYTTILPKIDGTWNLHNALGFELDFFVLFSSTSGLVGLYGQANNAAANTSLDVQYRHAKGLPASVIDLGVIEDVGYVSKSPSLFDYFRFLDADLLNEDHMREDLRLAISRSHPTSKEKDRQGYSIPSQTALGVRSHLSSSGPKNRIIWKRDRRFSVYHNIESTSPRLTTKNKSLRIFLNGLDTGASSGAGAEEAEYLAREIGRVVYGFMMQSPTNTIVDQPLSSLGLGSLFGIDLRNWCRTQI